MSADPGDLQIRYLGDVQRLVMKPGDKLVLTVPGPLSIEQHAFVRAQLTAFLGKGHEILVLEQGIKLEVLEAG